MNEVLTRLQQIGIVPVVVIDDVKDAAPLAKALCDGGLPCAEITFRTEAAVEATRIMATEYPDMLIGAGTILTVEQVDIAVAAGAKFIVSPGLNPKVVQYCVEKGIPVTPGITSPSQVEQAIELGLDTVKFFPAEAAGGLNMIKSMAAAYTNMKFMPTGGINPNNVNEYLAFNKILCCGGSWMVSGDLVKAGKFDEITRLTKEALMTMFGFELRHVGINCENDDQAKQTVKMFEAMFGFTATEKKASYFAGSAIEAMKSPYLGTKGHIAIATNDANRAKAYLENQGFEFNMDAALYNGDKLITIYFKHEVAGFAIHLIQK